MSAPDTNISKQRKRHKPALIGIVVAISIAVIAALGFGLWGGVSTDEQAAATVATDVESE